MDTAQEVCLIQEGGIVPMILRQALSASRRGKRALLDGEDASRQ